MQLGKARTGHSAALTCHQRRPHTPPRSRCVVWTRGGSRMRESRTYGSVRGALSNERPYRDLALAKARAKRAHAVRTRVGQRGRAATAARDGRKCALCPPYESNLKPDHCPMQIIRVGALDLHLGDFADT